MAEKVNWSFAIQVVGGPNLSAAASMTVEAYDKIQVDIDDNTTDKVVNLTPGTGSITLVAISPAKPDAKLTYKSGATDVKLDGPHVLIGEGAVSLLTTDAGSVKFTNKTGATASIQILIARDATP